MSHSLSKILLHVVFATKDRSNLIPKECFSELHAYIAKGVSELNGKAYRVGGISNHVHIAMNLPRSLSIGKMMERIKISSSKWMKEKENGVSNFKWQPGYGVFSLGESQLPILIKYIENQEAHHKTRTFENELKDICIKYNIPEKISTNYNTPDKG